MMIILSLLLRTLTRISDEMAIIWWQVILCRRIRSSCQSNVSSYSFMVHTFFIILLSLYLIFRIIDWRHTACTRQLKQNRREKADYINFLRNLRTWDLNALQGYLPLYRVVQNKLDTISNLFEDIHKSVIPLGFGESGIKIDVEIMKWEFFSDK